MDYRLHCDRLFFATTLDVPCEIFPQDTGLIVADAFGASIHCEAPEHRLHASTRKSMMLAFARAAALRLVRARRSGWDQRQRALMAIRRKSDSSSFPGRRVSGQASSLGASSLNRLRRLICACAADPRRTDIASVRSKPGSDSTVPHCVRDTRRYFGARLARMRCNVRRCMLRRRAVSETLRWQSS